MKRITGIRYDALISVNGYYFLASRIVCVVKNTNPLTLAIKLEGGCEISLTDTDHILNFRSQYVEYLTKNGILQRGQL